MLELNTHTFRRGTNSHETRHQRKTRTQKLHYVEVTAFSNATILRKNNKRERGGLIHHKYHHQAWMLRMKRDTQCSFSI